MEIKIKFTADTARRGEYFLQKRYGSKKKLQRLAKIAILEIITEQAGKELEDEKTQTIQWKI
jgi:hypothetical protein